MTLTLTFLALTLIISFGVLLINILTAPEGCEDETGFHVTGVAADQTKPAYAKVAVRRVTA